MNEKAYSKNSSRPSLAEGKMRLYSMRFCPYAHRARLVLEHKKIEYETLNINLKEKPSWFVDVNPNKTVPVLEYDEKIVYESLVICDYLDDVFPDNKLTPSDSYRKARDCLLIDMFSKVIHCYYKFYRDGTGSDDAKDFLEALDKFEEACENRRETTFLGGESVQMIDLMIWTHSERFEAIGELEPEAKVTSERFPTFCNWMENMKTVHAVQQCRLDTETHVHFIRSVREGNPDYDYGLE